MTTFWKIGKIGKIEKLGNEEGELGCLLVVEVKLRLYDALHDQGLDLIQLCNLRKTCAKKTKKLQKRKKGLNMTYAVLTPISDVRLFVYKLWVDL